ncbi:NeuD/PglB/VioB family sugar acetyltransferase [Sinomonas mesophila]|uniref:NeuD/PglB/VioB family sugar acetyltransferase n=1 Tax=Sinomonas mesophila TaxID=1531955 RepID=UPI00098417FF|nr:NeuD/PglB/VioB family sugar acetyltransferase [Sinomonas mesophila]
MSELLLLAASGLAREAMAMVREGDDYDVVGILDDDKSLRTTEVDGAHVLGPFELVQAYRHAQVALCMRSGAARERAVDRLAGLGFDASRYATLVHPSAVIPEGCIVGRGSILLANVVLTADVFLGEHVVVMPGVVLTHDDVVDDFATLAAGVCLGGSVRVGRGAHLGMNASVRDRTLVGAYSMVGMGASVVRNVPERETWVGVPAARLDEGGDVA